MVAECRFTKRKGLMVFLKHPVGVDSTSISLWTLVRFYHGLLSQNSKLLYEM